jgi:hypothetical protein
LKDKINELAMNSKNKNIHLYRGIDEFKRGYQPKSNLVNYENSDLFADSQNSSYTWKNWFSHLLNVHNVSDIRQIEIHTVEPLILDPSHLRLKLLLQSWKFINLRLWSNLSNTDSSRRWNISVCNPPSH